MIFLINLQKLVLSLEINISILYGYSLHYAVLSIIELHSSNTVKENAVEYFVKTYKGRTKYFTAFIICSLSFFSLLLYKEYTDKDVNEAIDTSGLREFVNNLSDGLNAILYDNGKNISGGERSRLVIVRDLYDRVLTVKKNIF